MKKVLFICITFVVTVISTSCFAGVDFILDLRPASMLFSPDVDGFKMFQMGVYALLLESKQDDPPKAD